MENDVQVEPIKRKRGRPPKKDRTPKLNAVRDRLTVQPDPELKAKLDALAFIHQVSFRGLIDLAVEKLRNDLAPTEKDLFDKMVSIRTTK
jgi:hypothetical protein